MTIHSEEFKREAVRLALTSGLPRSRVAPFAGCIGFGHWQIYARQVGVAVSYVRQGCCAANRFGAGERKASPRKSTTPGGEGDLKKSDAVLREPKAVRFAFVHSWRHRWPVELMCRVLQVSERGYRSWRSRPVSQRERTDMKVLAHIREQYSLSLGSYGRPRMTMELKEAGLDVGERRVGRLMRINAIRPVRTRKHKVTTDSHHKLGIAANWLCGDFSADEPNRKWAGDITYVWTHEGWLYLAVILDLHSRRVIGWAVSDRMKKDLAIRALDMAVRLRNPPPDCIFHSDRGSQYCSYDYQKKLQTFGLRSSMSGRAIVMITRLSKPSSNP